jgi:hypothetical protein
MKREAPRVGAIGGMRQPGKTASFSKAERF